MSFRLGIVLTWGPPLPCPCMNDAKPHLTIQKLVKCWHKLPDVAENEKPHNADGYPGEPTLSFFQQVGVVLKE